MLNISYVHDQQPGFAPFLYNYPRALTAPPSCAICPFALQETKMRPIR